MMLPRHIAIIMDGNGRWARLRGLPRVMGHRQGVKAVRRVVEVSVDLGLEALTLYAFSLENWKRSPKEVQTLMQMLAEYLEAEIPEFQEHQIRFMAIGRIQKLPNFVQDSLNHAITATQNNPGLKLVLALNYGGRAELVDAIRSMIDEVKTGKLDSEDIEEETVSRYLYTHDLPDPDLLIRTSGELRVSNFLLWQISYAEIYVTVKLWPDFTKEDFLEAIQDFQKRERRFGGEPVTKQLQN